jgi:hypothetical protein
MFREHVLAAEKKRTERFQTYPNQEACAYERDDSPQSVENCCMMKGQNRVKGVSIQTKSLQVKHRGGGDKRTCERSVAADDKHHSSEDA